MRSAHETTWRYRVGADSAAFLDKLLGSGWRFKYNGRGWWGGCAHQRGYVRWSGIASHDTVTAELCCAVCGRNDLARGRRLDSTYYCGGQRHGYWRHRFEFDGWPVTATLEVDR